MTDEDRIPEPLREQRRASAAKAPVRRNSSLLVRIAPKDAGRFHAYVESHGHLAYFTVLEPKTQLLRLFFTKDCIADVRRMLDAIGNDIPLKVSPWPFEDKN